MKAPIRPNSEPARLAALRRYNLLDTLPEQGLDDLTALAAQICGTPISLISLVDERRQWFKSKVGYAATETPREISFCGHALLEQNIFVVPDALQDERFADNPLVTGHPLIRFYAGAPLITEEGQTLGTLCVIDHVPRQLSASQLETLRVLSRQVMSRFELGRQTRELVQSEERLRVVTENARVGLVIVDQGRRYIYANAAYAEILGLGSVPIVGQRVPDVLAAVYETQIRPRLDRAFAGERVGYDLRKPAPDGDRHYAVRYEPTRLEDGAPLVVVVITDVTERTRAEAEGERQRAELELILDAVPALIFYKDSEGRFLRVNRELARVVGAPPETFIGKTDAEMGSSVGELYREDDVRVMATGAPITHIEEQIEGAEGARWLLTNKIPYRDAAGHVAGVIGFSVDITERKLAEELLRASYERFQIVARATNDALWDWNLSTDAMWWNEGHQSLFGYAKEETAPTVTSWTDYIHPDDLDRVIRGIRKVIDQGGHGWSDEYRFRRRDGSYAHVLDRGYILRDAHGKPARMIGAMQDVTERTHAAEALRTSEARYRTLFDYAPDGILIATPRGYYLDANRSICRMLGYARDELIGSHASDIVAPTEIQHIEPALNVINSRLDYHRDWQFRRQDGSTFSAEVIATQMPDGNLLAMIRDVTERNLAELRIRHLNRVYAVLSDINQTIVRETDPQAMLEAACRIAVEKGCFRMAWIGMVDPADGRVRITAHAGGSEETQRLVRLLLERAPAGGDCAITAHAIDSGEHAICNDIALDPRTEPWRESALRREFCSMTSLPLKAASRVIGTFNLYASEVGFFDANEMRLLDELALDISFALDFHEREKARRRAEQDLGESKERFSKVFHATPAAIVITTESEGRYLDVNDHFLEMFGYAREEVIGRTALELGVWAEPAQRVGILQMLQDGRRVRDIEVVYRTKSGELRYALASAELVRLGTVPCRLFINHDITERRQSEAALRESEARFRQLAENIQEVFWMTNPAKNQMLYISPAYEQIWGRTCESLYQSPRTWLDAIHPDDRERIQHAATTKQAHDAYNETYRIRRPDGSIRWIRDRAFSIRGAGGELLRVVGTAEDITERRQLEEQFRQSQKMEAIGQLAGGVAHDFNNILGAMMMQIDLASAPANLPSVSRDLLNDLKSCAERAANLTRQLLAFSRRQVMQPKLVDLNEVVTGLTKMLQRILGEDVRLQLNLYSRPLVTRADPGMLDQVLLNLVVNARDAMPDGGQLVLDTSEATFTEKEAALIPDAKPGRYVSLRVTDTGCGIAPENLARIFEPFFTTKEAGKGTGLGLATVFGIVKQHGGSIQARSEVGRGAQFDVFLPAAETAGPTDRAATAKTKPRAGTETILLVEDDTSVRALTRIVLEQSGYKVLAAANGVEALQLWDHQTGPIHLLLTDIVMPEGISGRQLAARLRERKPDLRVIFTSGYSAEIAGRELTLREGQNFLGKPARPDQILDTVRRALDN